DELPWLDTHKSYFLQAFSFFWNNFCSHRDDVLLIVSGSATSWMKNKIINDTGGMYNRLTRQIKLLPFNLLETENFLKYKGFKINRYDIVQYYMILGGIPHYLNLLDRGLTLADNIDNLFFKKNAELKKEYNNLFNSIFKGADKHISIIDALSTKLRGMTKKDILATSKLVINGHFSAVIKDLENNDLIDKYYRYPDKERNSIYQINDNFIFFYHSFLLNKNITNEHYWHDNQLAPIINTWRGYAFEMVCLQHIRQIKQGLGISGISCSISSYQDENCQIDLLINRADKVINLCEIKFNKDEFEIDKTYNKILMNRLNYFMKLTKYKYTIDLTMITMYGIKNNIYKSTVNHSLNAETLFIS
ncbi:MAG: hypothetical protein LBM99_04005, partial [Bacillales bacterium]|nr:hypothetical protein [Bacillales bacterium]